MTGKHHLKPGKDIARARLNAELAFRSYRGAIDPDHSPWDVPAIGRHRASGQPTLAHNGLVPDWEALVAPAPF